jgi:hypothetical protein
MLETKGWWVQDLDGAANPEPMLVRAGGNAIAAVELA